MSGTVQLYMVEWPPTPLPRWLSRFFGPRPQEGGGRPCGCDSTHLKWFWEPGWVLEFRNIYPNTRTKNGKWKLQTHEFMNQQKHTNNDYYKKWYIIINILNTWNFKIFCRELSLLPFFFSSVFHSKRLKVVGEIIKSCYGDFQSLMLCLAILCAGKEDH